MRHQQGEQLLAASRNIHPLDQSHQVPVIFYLYKNDSLALETQRVVYFSALGTI